MKQKMPKRPTDPVELAKLVGDMATGQAPKDDEAVREAKQSEQAPPIPSAAKQSALRSSQKRGKSGS